jgi:xanthine dehydrogenase YagT iron-sulfur-binding subunit
MSDLNERDEKPEAASRSEFGKSTRRTFISRIGMASLLATTGPAITTLGQRSEKVGQGLSAGSKDAIPVTLRVNGKKYDLRIDPRTTLLDCLREHLHLAPGRLKSTSVLSKEGAAISSYRSGKNPTHAQ